MLLALTSAALLSKEGKNHVCISPFHKEKTSHSVLFAIIMPCLLVKSAHFDQFHEFMLPTR
jgi:hypothetical protein